MYRKLDVKMWPMFCQQMRIYMHSSCEKSTVKCVQMHVTRFCVLSQNYNVRTKERAFTERVFMGNKLWNLYKSP